MDDDDAPRPGSPLALLQSENIETQAIAALQARIMALKTEITRTQAMIARKEASRNIADSIFKK